MRMTWKGVTGAGQEEESEGAPSERHYNSSQSWGDLKQVGRKKVDG